MLYLSIKQNDTIMNGNRMLILNFSLVELFLLFQMMIYSAFATDTIQVTFQTYTYKEIGSLKLELDVFTPSKENAVDALFPVIILFHGGGWVAGKRESLHSQCKFFAEHGIVAVTADYRFVDRQSQGINITKEICIRDAKSAIRWVKSHTGKLHIDTLRIIFGGGSAGGHLATMAALDQTINDPRDDNSISTRADLLVLFNPAYTLDDNSSLQPFNFISSSAPPTIMFFGSNDHWKLAADTVYSILKRKGVRTEMWVAEGQKHAFFNREPWAQATCKKAYDFLVKCNLIKSEIPQQHSSIDSLVLE